MKKSLVALFLALVFVISSFPVSACADYEPEVPLSPAYVSSQPNVTIYGYSGTTYFVSFVSSAYYVGYTHSPTTATIKVCQAFCNGVNVRYGARNNTVVTTISVDGEWGPNSDAALRAAQTHSGTTSDGDCRTGTWQAMYGYLGESTTMIKDYL